MAQVFSLGTAAVKYAETQVNTIGTNVPEAQKGYLNRRFQVNYLTNWSNWSTVVAAASLAAAILTAMPVLFLAITAAALIARHSAQKHLNAAPAVPLLQYGATYFEPNSQQRASDLRKFLGLPNTLPPAEQAERQENGQAAAPAPAPAQLWQPSAIGLFGVSLWNNKAPVDYAPVVQGQAATGLTVFEESKDGLNAVGVSASEADSVVGLARRALGMIAGIGLSLPREVQNQLITGLTTEIQNKAEGMEVSTDEEEQEVSSRARFIRRDMSPDESSQPRDTRRRGGDGFSELYATQTT